MKFLLDSLLFSRRFPPGRRSPSLTRIISLTSLLPFFTGSGGAAATAPTVLPLMPRPPVLDGRITPAEWRVSARFPYFAWKGRLVRRRADAFIGATKTHLFVGVISRLPDEGALTTKVSLDTPKIVYDDSIELWIDPTPGSRDGRTFQMLTNAAGHCGYVLHVRGRIPENPAWRGTWTVRHGFHGREWHCEIAVPLAEIAPGRTALDGRWAVNVCRNWKQPWQFSSIEGGGYAPKTMLFRFVPEGTPAVHVDFDGDPFTGRFSVALDLFNPGPVPVSVVPEIVLERDLMPALRTGGRPVVLAPGQARRIDLRCTDASTRKFRLRTTVRTVDPERTVYDRTVVWERGPEKWKWIAKTPPPPPPVDVRFAVYPYAKTLRVAVDCRGVPDDARLDAIRIFVRPVGSAIKLFSLRITGVERDRPVEKTLPFDPPPGRYELVVRAEGRNIPGGDIVKPFERKRFEWEHNPAGRSDRTWPPFTPIEVEGRVVRTVLREHRMNDLGLWDQVTAESAHTHVRRPILAAPMEYRVVVEGRPIPIRPAERLRLERRSQRTASGRAVWEGGGLRGETRITWDCDGLMRVDLHLASESHTSPPRLDQLQLRIPFRADAATHIHAMADGIRNTIYGRIPQGEGVVWDSRRVAVNEFPRNFCTYIFVGTPVRGVCWFTETPAGWSWDPRTPNVELRRRDGMVVLAVHFVNRPRVLAEPLDVTFGLQAAPVKPRLKPWRHRWFRDGYTLLGTDINWFALGNCGAVYPAGKDMFLWKMLARGNREHLTDDDIRRTIERGRRWFEPYGEEYVRRFETHVRYNLRARYGKRMVFYYNRAGYQAAEEFQTFQDEWSLTDFRTIGPGNSVNEIKIVPSESYIDHALYWYAKSFDIAGNQGVYWDNWFLVASYNTFMTSAVRLPDGRILPSTGLLGLRELARRTFHYMNERGMRPITMAHMTSTAILPMLSYCTVQYDWEWKYSQGDFQDRFSRDYILLVTNGELAGAWPVLLHDHGPLADDAWTQRTCAAVCIVHELDPPVSTWSRSWKTVWKPLLTPIHRLLDDPHLEVWRYWDERPQPVRSNSPDLPVIVYAVPGREAVAAVAEFAGKDADVVLRVDAAALGLPRGYRIEDVEGRSDFRVEGDRILFRLKAHDVREFRMVCASELVK